jgi:hypothetical protein
MASEVSIAIRVADAIDKLESNTRRMADHHGMEPITLVRNARGGDKMLQALQLEALAAWLEILADKLNPPAPTAMIEVTDGDAAEAAPTRKPRR